MNSAESNDKSIEWKNAIVDALDLVEIANQENLNDPKKAIDDLIDWHVSVNLDRKVSSAAEALFNDGYSAGTKDAMVANKDLATMSALLSVVQELKDVIGKLLVFDNGKPEYEQARQILNRQLDLPHKFKKKPIVVDAVQLNRNISNSKLDWVEEAFEDGTLAVICCSVTANVLYYVKTLEGTMTGHEGDWLIRGIDGELYPCKKEIFERTYESA